MMKMKKLVSLLLAALMVVCLLSVSAFADEYNSGDKGGVQMALTVEGTVRYTVTVLSVNEEYGTVTGGGTYDEGAPITVTAIPNNGYIFTGWRENGEKVENAGASYTFSVNADRNLTAEFAEDKGATCLLSIYDSDYFNFIGIKPVPLYSPGELVTVTAVPKHGGIRFLEWYEALDPTAEHTEWDVVSQSATYSFNIEKDTKLRTVPGLVQYVTIDNGSLTDGFTVESWDANQPVEKYGVTVYTSDGPGDLKFHFPPADCFTAPEGMVFDCWEVNGVGYEADSVQTVIGSDANPAFSVSSFTAFAKWKKDESKTLKCVISIPAQIEIPYEQEYTSVPWEVVSLDLGAYRIAHVTFFEGKFLNQRNNVIKYYVKDIAAEEETNSYTYDISQPEKHTIQVYIPTEEWANAEPGRYTATMPFEVKGAY